MAKISAVVAIIIIVTSSVLLSFYLRFELPDTTPNLIIPTLEGQVTVTQDQYGIYHIDAKNQKSGLMAEGYLMARERLWQMDFYRREAEGNLSQIFYSYDSSILQVDYSLRALGLYRIAARDWSTFDKNTTDFYQEFVDGVNLFIKNNENKLPVEFGILGYTPALWSPIDSIAILKLVAFGLNAQGGGEPLIGQALSSMNATYLLDFVRLTLNNNNITWSDPVAYPVASTSHPKASNTTTVITNTTNTTMTTPPSTTIPTSQSSLYSFLISQFSFNNVMGSNNWVVSGNKTITGKPMLANDPHLSLETPSKWWFVDLKIDGDFHVTGATLPGIPGIVLGRNDYIMWGFTNTEIDYLDTYVETFNANYTQYYYNGAWLNTTILNEKFYTSFTSFKVLPIYITNGYNNFTHGTRPVVPMYGANVSVRWTGQDSSSAAESLVLMMKSQNQTEFIQALELFNAPGQNVVYADNLGNIGLYVTGDIPIRNAGYGLAPHNGSLRTYNWKGMVPRTDAYQIVNPLSGFIATANDNFIPSTYSYNGTPIFLGYAFDSGYRAQRIRELLNITSPITYGYMELIQNDVYSIFAKNIVSKILIPSSDPFIQSMENELRNWNFDYGVNSIQGSILALFTNYFLNFTLSDKLPKGFLSEIPVQGKLTENLLNLPQNSFWFNDTNTFLTKPKPNTSSLASETKNDIILKAYEAVKEYYLSHNLNIQTFTWGQLHKVQFSHVIGNRMSILSFLNAGQLQPSPGDMYTINVGTYNSNFIQTEGASLRQIMGMDSNQTYLVIIPPGQSGLVGQNHYADQITRWLEGNYCAIAIEK